MNIRDTSLVAFYEDATQEHNEYLANLHKHMEELDVKYNKLSQLITDQNNSSANLTVINDIDFDVNRLNMIKTVICLEISVFESNTQIQNQLQNEQLPILIDEFVENVSHLTRNIFFDMRAPNTSKDLEREYRNRLILYISRAIDEKHKLNIDKAIAYLRENLKDLEINNKIDQWAIDQANSFGLKPQVWISIYQFINLLFGDRKKVDFNAVKEKIQNTTSIINLTEILNAVCAETTSNLFKVKLASICENLQIPALLSIYIGDSEAAISIRQKLKIERSFPEQIETIKEEIDTLKIIIYKETDEILINLLRLHALHAFRQTLLPLEPYSGYVNYNFILHWMHHTKSFLKGSGGDEPIYQFMRDLFSESITTYYKAVSLVERFFSRHQSPTGGLHMNSFDTYFLELLYNEGYPKGMLRLALSKNQLGQIAESMDDLILFGELNSNEALKTYVMNIPCDNRIVIQGEAASKIRGPNREPSALSRHSIYRANITQKLIDLKKDLIRPMAKN